MNFSPPLILTTKFLTVKHAHGGCRTMILPCPAEAMILPNISSKNAVLTAITPIPALHPKSMIKFLISAS